METFCETRVEIPEKPGNIRFMAAFREIAVSKWLVAAIVAALAELTIAPSDAQARCGDYVMLGGHAAQHLPTGSDNILMPWQPAAAHVTAHSDPAHPDRIDAAPGYPRPCSGPNCSNDVPRPLDAPAAPVEIDVRHWGLIAVEGPRPMIVHQIARFSDDAVRSRIAVGAIFRPPR